MRCGRPFAMWLACVAMAAMEPMASTQARSPVLGVTGSAFTVNGQPKFLLFMSYFDAMRASNLDDDLTYIKSLGFDGIRIFPNWDRRDAGYCATTSTDTLMDTSGAVRRDRL